MDEQNIANQQEPIVSTGRYDANIYRRISVGSLKNLILQLLK